MPDPRDALGFAQEALAKIERLAPGHPGAAAANIRLTSLLGDLETSLKLSKTAVSQHPNDPLLQLRLAQTLNGLGLHDAAVTAAERALLLSPRPDGELWRHLAGVFNYLGQSERAKDLIARARKVGADEYETAFVMAAAHVNLGELEAAKKETTTILGRWQSANLTLIRVLYQHIRDPEFENRTMAPLAKAGIPEWPHDLVLDKAKRVVGEELREIFRPPVTIEGAFFKITDIKGDLLCVHRPWKLMGRSYCTPVYRDSDFIAKHANTAGDFIARSVHGSGKHPGYDVFSVKHGK